MLDELREQFLPEFAVGARARLRAALSQIPPIGPGGEAGAKSIASLMHTMAGEAMLIGYPELAQLARNVGAAARQYLEAGQDPKLVACARALRTLSRALEDLLASASTPAPQPEEADEPAANANDERLRVLIVDDSSLNAALLREGLINEGFDATAVGDDFDLIMRQMDMLRPHVLLVDWLMPGCDTSALCRHIQSTPALQKTRVLLVTSLPEDEAEAQAQKLGIAGALSKEQGVAAIGSRLRALAERPT